MWFAPDFKRSLPLSMERVILVSGNRPLLFRKPSDGVSGRQVRYCQGHRRPSMLAMDLCRERSSFRWSDEDQQPRCRNPSAASNRQGIGTQARNQVPGTLASALSVISAMPLRARSSPAGAFDPAAGGTHRMAVDYLSYSARYRPHFERHHG
jgi:hypothetical protein